MNYFKNFLVLCLGISWLSGCSEDNSTVDPALPSSSASFTGMKLSHYAFDTDTMNVVPGKDKLPGDPVQVHLRVEATTSQVGGGVGTARCKVLFAGNTSPVFDGAMVRDGNGKFSLPVSFSIQRGDVGEYGVQVTGEDGAGKPVNLALSQFVVFFGTKPPVLSELYCPDSLVLPNSEITIIPIVVRVTDPSGPADIKRVLFNSYLPSGTPSVSNPFLMYDDGTHGDQNGGDGLYTLTIQLPPTAQKGKYRFEFQAFDLSNLASNVIKHALYVQ